MNISKVILTGCFVILIGFWLLIFTWQSDYPSKQVMVNPIPGLDRYEEAFDDMPEEYLTENFKNGLYIKTTAARNVFEFGIAAVDSVYGKAFFIDKKSNRVFDKTFERVGCFDADSGLAAVKENGKYGFINTKGQYVIKPKYDYTDGFYGGRAKVIYKGVMQVIDTDDKVIYQPEIGNWYELPVFPETNHIKRTPKFKQFLPGGGIMYDMNDNPLHGGKIYSVPVCCDMEDFSRYIFVEYDTKKVGITDEYGRFIAEPQFKAIYWDDGHLNENFYRFSKDGYIFCFGFDDNYLIDKDGKVVFEMSKLKP